MWDFEFFAIDIFFISCIIQGQNVLFKNKQNLPAPKVWCCLFYALLRAVRERDLLIIPRKPLSRQGRNFQANKFSGLVN